MNKITIKGDNRMTALSLEKPEQRIEKFSYLHSVLPSKNNSTTKKVIKIAIAVLTLGLSILFGGIAELVRLSTKSIKNAIDYKTRNEMGVSEKLSHPEVQEITKKPFWTPAKKITALTLATLGLGLAIGITYDQYYQNGTTTTLVKQFFTEKFNSLTSVFSSVGPKTTPTLTSTPPAPIPTPNLTPTPPAPIPEQKFFANNNQTANVLPWMN